MSGYSEVRLQFWAKAYNFESDEEAYCMISPDDVTWYPVHTWIDGNDDDIYHYFDIDLSSYPLTSNFWIAFDAEMSDTGDYFYVDDIEIIGS